MNAFLLKLISLVGCSLSTLLLAIAAPSAHSAERLSLSYGILRRSIAVDSLETYAKTGEVNDDLDAYVQDATPEQAAQLRRVLLTPIPLNEVEVSQFLYTAIGERLLERIGGIIQTDAPESSFYALRSALILAAANPDGFTPLTVLQQFPLEELDINLTRSLQLVDAVQQLVSQTQQTIGQINEQSQLQANTASFTALLSDNLSQPGGFAWEQETITLNDQSRDRTFPVDLYLPLVPDPRPVIVISHGLGSDRFSFAYLAEHLASYGFVVAVPEHPGSSAEQLRALLQGRADQVTSPREFIDRPLDVKYLLDELDRLSESNITLRNRLNLQQVGVIGQSFGGYTALALAGATLDLEQLETDCRTLAETLNLSLVLQCLALRLPRSQYDLSDSRIKAAIAINPVDSSILGQSGLSQIDIPVMMIASSADAVAPALSEQIQPFTWIASPNKYLVLINNATHFSTVDESPNAVVPVPPEVIGANPSLARQYVRILNTAFFQTHVANQSSYRSYLSSAYIKSISREPLPLSLVQSLTNSRITLEEGNR